MNTIGHNLRVTTFGESHGPFVGVVVDGFPSNIPFPHEQIQKQLDRRRPGQSSVTTTRNEQDKVIVISGTSKATGYTIGTPITMIIENKDMRSKDYDQYSKSIEETDEVIWTPRPSHADATYFYKYGIMQEPGGGRASARETCARVSAGALADFWLKQTFNINIVAWVSQVGHIAFLNTGTIPSREQVDANIIKCPDNETSKKMIEYIEELRQQGDSVGAIITCCINNVPPGLGEPVFDKLPALLAHAMMSIPSTKGFDYGSGFDSVTKRGSMNNDRFIRHDNRLYTDKNDSGGIQGGITNGEHLYFRVAFKPPSTISLSQETLSISLSKSGSSSKIVTLKNQGRHDPCVAPRAVPIVESMAALVVMDCILSQLRNNVDPKKICHYIS